VTLERDEVHNDLDFLVGLEFEFRFVDLTGFDQTRRPNLNFQTGLDFPTDLDFQTWTSRLGLPDLDFQTWTSRLGLQDLDFW
jgi:hypothetical protein